MCICGCVVVFACVCMYVCLYLSHQRRHQVWMPPSAFTACQSPPRSGDGWELMISPLLRNVIAGVVWYQVMVVVVVVMVVVVATIVVVVMVAVMGWLRR